MGNATSDVLQKAKGGNSVQAYASAAMEDDEGEALQAAMEPRLC